MNKLLNCNSHLILLSMLSFWSPASPAEITKKEAYVLLQQQAFKWKLINSISEDADIKLQAASSAFKPKVQLALKQFYAKINPIQYGGEDKSVLDQVGFGTTALEMNWPVLDPVAKVELETAQIKSQSAQQQVIQNQNDLTALMLFQFLNVQKLRRQLEVMEANLQKSQLILKLAQSKNKVGAGIALDVARAKNLFELDRLKKINSFNKYLKSVHELTTTLGIEKLKDNLESLKIEKFPPAALRQLLDKALANRGDLKAAELNFNAATELAKDSKKIFFPKLSIFGEVGTTQASVLGLPAKTASGLVGVVFSIPLESGGLIASKKREALSLANKANLYLQQTKLEVLSQVKEALEQILSTEEALAAAEAYVKTVKEESDIAEKRFSYGASNILDFSNSHTNFSNAQDTLTEAMFNFEAAKLNYYRTLGSFEGYFNDIK